RVFPDLAGPSLDVFFIYPADLRRSKRIKAFRHYLLQQAVNWRAR
ncbi:MAG: hypothetical protein RLZZ157_1891, partial [Pseudomonadota bacterium]